MDSTCFLRGVGPRGPGEVTYKYESHDGCYVGGPHYICYLTESHGTLSKNDLTFQSDLKMLGNRLRRGNF